MTDPAPTDPAPALSGRRLALVALGALVGTELRYLLARAEPIRAGSLPVATVTVNLVGAFLLGVVLEVLASHGPRPARRYQLRLLLGTGFCGGFTTYSTFAVETDLLIRHGSPAMAVAYVAATVLLGLLVCALGVAVGGRFSAGRGR